MEDVVRRPVDLALPTGPVVGQEHHHGVLPHPEFLEGLTQAPHTAVDVRDGGGVGGHVAGEEPTGVVRQVVPRHHVVAVLPVALRQTRPGRHHAQVELPFVSATAHLVPASVVDPVEGGDVLGAGVEGGVGGGMGEVEEERLIGPDGVALAHHGDRLVGEVVGQVVAVGVGVDVEVGIVGDELVGMVEVGEGVEDAVEALEAPLQWPRVHRAGRRRVGVTTQVPLPHTERRPPGVPERLGHGDGVVGQLRPIPGKAGVVLGDVADAGPMRGQSGQQRCAGRRAHRGDVEIGELETLTGQTVEVRRGDLRPLAPEIGEPDVVHEDHDDVGRPRRSGGTLRPLGVGGRHGGADVLHVTPVDPDACGPPSSRGQSALATDGSEDLT